MKKKLLIFIFILVSMIAFGNAIGNQFFLYWKFWWFDIVMHFLGGLWIGLTALWVYYFSGYFKGVKKSASFIFLTAFLTAFLIGLGWEVFEFLIEVDFSNNYISDTALDLIMDIVGSIVASLVFLRVNNSLKL